MQAFVSETLNQRLFDLYVLIDDGVTRRRLPPHKLFNEAYYQCTRAVYYNCSSADSKTLENDIRDSLGMREAIRTVFRLMYAILASRRNNTQATEAFARQIAMKADMENASREFLDFITQTGKKDERQIIDLSPKPCSTDGLNVYSFYWHEVTHGYDMDAIKRVRDLWDSPKDKLTVLGLIEDAYQLEMTGKLPDKDSGKQDIDILEANKAQAAEYADDGKVVVQHITIVNHFHKGGQTIVNSETED